MKNLLIKWEIKEKNQLDWFIKNFLIQWKIEDKN